MHITPTSLTINQLLSSTNERYVVPAYQRRYSWHEKQIRDLLDDIELLEPSDTHLLGSIVCLTGAHTAGINALELVDGQQRLTTVCILLQCIHERLIELGCSDVAQEIAPLLTARALNAPPVGKVALDSLDSALFDRLVKGHKDDGSENPALAQAFAEYRRWIGGKDAPELAAFLYRLRTQVLVVRLEVSQAKDAFKLFETINNRGLRLSHTDIIKNFLLGNAARFGEESLALARERWAAVVRALDGVSAETFLRQFVGAHLRRRVTKAFVVGTFKRIFMAEVEEALSLPEHQRYVGDDADEDDGGLGDTADVENVESAPPVPTTRRISFAEFLERLVTSARHYGAIWRATTGNERIDRHLRNLKMIKAVQTYGFLMRLRVGGCADDAFARVLQLTEAFLLRRHVCRMRANETETAFARLCGVDCSNPAPEVITTYREYSPSDERFRQDFASAKFGSSLVERARYCLMQFETHRQGRHLELLVGGPDIVHVEHVIPRKIKTRKAKKQFGDWPSYLGPQAAARHPRYVSRIGNLTLFAGSLNIGASNNPYERKKAAYRKSAIEVTKTLPDKFPEFRFEQVEQRSAQFAELAVTLWPIP